MDLNKTPRLLIMMFIQYFMQGAWNMTMGLVLSTYGMATIIGSSYALLGLATIISPLFIGMVADRFFSSQKVMAILHLINAGVLLFVPQFIEAQNTGMTLTMIFLVGLLFYPTTALANSISFSHINGVKYFPFIRVFGTFGFMASALSLVKWDIPATPSPGILRQLPVSSWAYIASHCRIRRQKQKETFCAARSVMSRCSGTLQRS
jgi:MFS family permease